MGFGSYSVSDRSERSTSRGYATKSAHEIFTQRSINNAMNPNGVMLRESRDSEEHPSSVPIIVALDVTGSMGSVPHHLVKEGLPKMMSGIMQAGIPDPQVLFLAIGDHECDRSPLQVGQFESNDELLDKWLTDVFLEGGGGGNAGESYFLAWYFAAQRTAHDAFDKRGQKGFLFTIGDEPTLKSLPKNVVREIMGDGQYDDYTAASLLDAAREKYHVYHLHIRETHAGSRKETVDGWRQLMQDNLVIVDRKEDVSRIIAEIVVKNTPVSDAKPIDEQSDNVAETGSTGSVASDEML
jgi:ribosome modulation factor